MPKQPIYPNKGAAPRAAYSPGMRAGDFIFVAGQGPFDPDTGQIVGATVEEQTRQTLANVRAVLEAAGASLADVVKVTAHLADMADFDAYNRAYAEIMPEPRPVRTTVASGLHGFLVEIDAIAYVGA